MAPQQRSPAFRAFVAEFFDRSSYEQWHDGVNLSVLHPLSGEERAEAETMLIDSLETGGMWASLGLGALKSVKALPRLKAVAARSCGSDAVHAAVAIESIEGKGEAIPFIIDRLQNAGAWGTRIDAAMALRKYPQADVIDALHEALLDADGLVRHHAAESLLAIHGMAPDIAAHREIFRALVVDKERDGKPPREHHEVARRMLRELLATRPPVA